MKYIIVAAIVVCIAGWVFNRWYVNDDEIRGQEGLSKVHVEAPDESVDSVDIKGPDMPKDHGEIRADAIEHWQIGTQSFESYFEALAPDPDRLVALNALRDQFSKRPKYFSSLIEKLPIEASRNSLKEALLSKLAFDKSPKEAIDFVFAESGVGRKRSEELYPLYFSWFLQDPEGAIRDASRLEFREDLKVFETLLDKKKSRVTIEILDAAEDAGVAQSLMRKISQLALENLAAKSDRDTVIKEYPKISRYLGGGKE
jgi:hypothetical protein